MIIIGLALLSVPTGAKPSLSNYGVKRRDSLTSLSSHVVSEVPPLQERAYRNIEEWSFYINQCGEIYKIPPITLAAILYEESVHRKPVDIKTFGPAQLGLEELRKQGFPENKEILEDPELAILVLARKLHRLRKETGSLNNAIVLHNGYDDYLKSVKDREKDNRLRMILTVKRIFPVTSL